MIRTFIFNRYCQKLPSIYTSSNGVWGYLFSCIFTNIWHYRLLDYLPIRLGEGGILLLICMSQISMKLSIFLHVYGPFSHRWISNSISFACFSIVLSHNFVYDILNCNRHLKSLMESDLSIFSLWPLLFCVLLKRAISKLRNMFRGSSVCSGLGLLNL